MAHEPPPVSERIPRPAFDLALVGLERSLELVDRRHLSVELLPRDRVLFDEDLVTLQVELCILELRRPGPGDRYE